jgi:hypothetical protein
LVKQKTNNLRPIEIVEERDYVPQLNQEEENEQENSVTATRTSRRQDVNAKNRPDFSKLYEECKVCFYF